MYLSQVPIIVHAQTIDSGRHLQHMDTAKQPLGTVSGKLVERASQPSAYVGAGLYTEPQRTAYPGPA